ncbi:MAG: ATP synthase subunit C [Spirochaetia bacterium]|nr:ATP synthase subunit C [Spirochaetales bacterium]MDX9784516.1 ATP synthase subunit C [Spirochaetia bacterium]
MSEKRAFRARAISIGSLTILLAVVLALAAVGNVFGQSVDQNAGQQVVSQAAQPLAGAEAAAVAQAQAEVQKYGLLAAAAAFGLGAIGAGIAIGNVGSAAMGAIGEKPEIASQALIFVALAEGLVVFGFITALMILGRV